MIWQKYTKNSGLGDNMIQEVNLPLGGYSEGMSPDKQQPMTTAYCSNIRARDTLERKIRIGQRPGLKKAYSVQIGGAASPIVALLSITRISAI
jgi:hypothetical protein